jgi:tetraacyldisaccharide 4'-kinase
VGGGVSGALGSLGAALYGGAWEMRRRAYASGLLWSRRVGARVVSVGNLTVGGTGKTTLTLRLARRALERGLAPAVVCRRYHPGPGGRGDEELMYRGALGADRVFAGASKLELADAAARAGFNPVIVDDGYSHWPLARDVDVVLLDAHDLTGGGRLLPAGRLREPLRALQRASAVVVSRLGAGEDPKPWLERAGAMAPGAMLAAARHCVKGVRALGSGQVLPGARVRVVSATGNPAAVEASAREAGLEVASASRWRDHHWFTPREARQELTRADGEGAWVLLTCKDAVRWPESVEQDRVAVLEVEWEWVAGGGAVEDLAFGGLGV